MKVLVSVASLTTLLFFDVAFVLPTLSPPPLDWTRYHNYNDIVTTLLSLNHTHSDVVDVFSIGKSWENRDIYAVRLTNESDHRSKPEVFYAGYHHAREQITSELTFYFVVYAVKNFGSNQTVTELLNKSEIYVVVALNVDGFDLFEENGNQRNSAHGVDLNRNYGYQWSGSLSHGAKAFSEPETRAVRDFVLAHHFRYALSFHSGIELILYPWSYTLDSSPDEAEYIRVSEGLSNRTGGTPYKQSSHLYISYGTWDDWMYGVAGVFALTAEVFVANLTLVGGGGRPSYDGEYNPVPTHSNYAMQYSLRYVYNPAPVNLEKVILRWLPAFFYVANRTINEPVF